MNGVLDDACKHVNMERVYTCERWNVEIHMICADGVFAKVMNDTVVVTGLAALIAHST